MFTTRWGSLSSIVSLMTIFSYTPLYYAMREQHSEIVSLLIHRGAEYNVQPSLEALSENNSTTCCSYKTNMKSCSQNMSVKSLCNNL